MTEHRANILDPIHDALDTTVFDRADADMPKLKPKHRKWIKEAIYRTLENAGYDGMDEWLHLVFTGSLCTYQYSADSDVDISLFVNADRLPEWSRAEMIGIMVENLDGTTLPGTTHIMQDFVIPPDVDVTDLYKPGLRSGYDLTNDYWIVPPERDRVHDVSREMNNAYVHALEQADKMDRLLRYEPDKAIILWHQIHKRRQRDMRAGKGDYSDSNITYKMLANRGLFPRISDYSGEYIAKTAELDEHYIDEKAAEIRDALTEEERPDKNAETLYRLYAVLALTKGKDTTLEDVHDAWAAWTAESDAEHESLIPFEELTKKIQEYDRPYMDAIHKCAAVPGAPNQWAWEQANQPPPAEMRLNQKGCAYCGATLNPTDQRCPQCLNANSPQTTGPGQSLQPIQPIQPAIVQPPQQQAVTSAILPPPEQIEEARRQLGLRHPVRVLPTYNKRGGYAGITRDPITGGRSHLVYVNPEASPGPRNWALWHELGHAKRVEDGGEFTPNDELSQEEYTNSPNEQHAEGFADQHADWDLWGNQ